MKKQMMKMVVGLALTLVSYSAFAGEVKVQYNCKTNYTETCAALKDLSKYSREHNLGWKLSSEISRESLVDLMNKLAKRSYDVSDPNEMEQLMSFYDQFNNAFQAIIAYQINQQLNSPAYRDALEAAGAINRGILEGLERIR